MTAVTLQDARLALVRDRVLDGVAEVLERGDELTFAKVAAAAGVPERTVYRHFPTRQALMTAVFEWVNQKAGVHERPTTAVEAREVVRRTFPAFDEVAPVMRELLAGPDGLPARLAGNEQRRRAALDLVHHHVPDADAPTATRLAAVVQLLMSAAAWQTMRDYWDLEGSEAAEASALAIDLLLGATRPAPPKKTSSKKGPRS